MTDAGWAAAASMVTAICTLLAALFAKQARDQSQDNSRKIDENTERIASHDEASAERSQALKSELATERRLRPPAPESDVREPEGF